MVTRKGFIAALGLAACATSTPLDRVEAVKRCAYEHTVRAATDDLARYDLTMDEARAHAYRDMSWALRKLGRYRDSLTVADSCLAELRDNDSPVSSAVCSIEKASAYSALSDPGSAEATLIALLEAGEDSLPLHLHGAALGELCVAQADAGALSSAAETCRHALQLLESTPGGARYVPDVKSSAITIAIHRGQYEDALQRIDNWLGSTARREYYCEYDSYWPFLRSEIMRQRGNVTEALDLARSAVELAENQGAPRELVRVLHQLGLTLQYTGQPHDAVRVQTRALDLARETDADGPEVPRSALNLAGALKASGRIEAAAPYYIEAVAGFRRVHGDIHPDTAVALHNLGELHLERGELTAAREALEQAIETKQTLDPGSVNLSLLRTLNALAILEHQAGDFKEALRIRNEIRLGAASIGSALYSSFNLQNIAAIRRSLNDDEGASAAVAESMEFLSGMDQKHPNVLRSRSNAAVLLTDLGRVEDAIIEFEAILEIERARGDRHPRVADALSKLAKAKGKAGLLAEEEALLRAALTIREGIADGLSADVAESLADLADLAERRGDLLVAIERRSRASDAFQKLYGPHHQLVGIQQMHIARTALRFGDGDLAREMSALAMDVAIPLVMSQAFAWSERRALRWLEKHDAFIETFLAAHSRDVDGDIALRTLSQWHATVDAVLSRPELPEDDDLLRMSRELAHRMSSPRAQIGIEGQWSDDLVELALSRESILNLSSGASSVGASHATPAAVCRSLKPGQSVIQFYTAAAPPEDTAYGAFVLVGGECAQGPRTVAFPTDAATIDSHVDEWVKTLDGAGSRVEESAIARRLFDEVWAPLVPVLRDSSDVVLVPDGELFNLPFSALVTPDGGRLIDTITLSQADRVAHLAGGVDDEGLKPGQPGLVVGGVDFGVPQDGVVAWEALPSSDSEAREVAAVLGPQIQHLHGHTATVAAVQEAMFGPAVIHIATHSYNVLSPQDPVHPEAVRRASRMHPMALSGLVLAGANVAGGDRLSVLTAERVSRINLGGVNLVVLSACNTARGIVSPNVGVLGLRYGFLVAGADNLVLSLWRISDDSTAELMGGFYKHHAAGKSVRSSLRLAQLDLMEGGAPPRQWAPFVAVRGPSSIDGEREQ